MTAQPRAGRAVACFARNAFVDVRSRREPGLGNGLERRMANRAARVGGRFAAADGLGDSRRACISQNNKRLGVKIFLRPGDVLAALFAGAAVATGRSTTDRSDELRAVFARLLYLFGRKCRAEREEKNE